MDKIVLFKWVSAASIFLSTVIGSALPMFIRAAKWTSRLESLAGGVFLGAGLAHLLADSYEEFRKIPEEHQINFPIGPATCLATFVLLTFVELFSYSESDANAFGDHTHSHPEEKSGQKSGISYDNIEDDDAKSLSTISNAPLSTGKIIKIFGSDLKGITTAMVSLYIIMDIHSTIEGLALGILSTWSSVIAIFCAIIGHKPVEAFALSLIILKDKPTKIFFWVFVAIYSILTPIGIIAGIYLQEMSGALALGLIAAFSAGTFLFVGCHEWGEMFEKKTEWSAKEKGWHFSMFAIGITWMLLIAIVETLE